MRNHMDSLATNFNPSNKAPSAKRLWIPTVKIYKAEKVSPKRQNVTRTENNPTWSTSDKQQLQIDKRNDGRLISSTSERLKYPKKVPTNISDKSTPGADHKSIFTCSRKSPLETKSSQMQ